MSNQYKATDMLSVEEALDQILAFTRVLDAEPVGLVEASGRVLAEDVTSDIDIAPFDNSGMDGFAVRAANTATASPETPVRLAIAGAIGAGEVFDGVIEDGSALRIMTGAPLPTGADTVVKIEDVSVGGEGPLAPGGTEVYITKPLIQGKNVRLHGEEARAGEVLLTAGTLLNPAGVGLLAATGNTRAQVYRRPRVALLASGDELVDPSQKPGPGQIRNSNSFALAAAVRAAGGEVGTSGIVRDDALELRAAIARAAASHDLVLISGGAAEGDYDYTYRCIKELGEVFFTRVNMRPGKAQTLGIIDGTMVFGLAGNPTAAMVGFEVLLRPALRRMQGHTALKRPVTRARLTVDVAKPDSRRFYVRARMQHDRAKGEYSVTPEKNQSSALLGALQQANCLIVLPEGLIGNTQGEVVACLRLDVDEGVVI
ncbi:MAG: molybdopterin molybdotransferase MoeA [Coriobacteriales bacterium]|jgi:molybdopterin molybdotransferase|nr:molybdopterin molybdotransferase MoeA [Coriobacteriales bacterium]